MLAGARPRFSLSCRAAPTVGYTCPIAPPVGRNCAVGLGPAGSGGVVESADEVLVEAEVFCGGFHGESAVELFANTEVELA